MEERQQNQQQPLGDFDCTVCGHQWHYDRKANVITRNGYRMRALPLRFTCRKTFENYARRFEYGLN